MKHAVLHFRVDNDLFDALQRELQVCKGTEPSMNLSALARTLLRWALAHRAGLAISGVDLGYREGWNRAFAAVREAAQRALNMTAPKEGSP
jgi:hypothetical protein